MPFFYDYPNICAECIYLEVRNQMKDRGEQQYFYECKKLHHYVDARSMVNNCKEGMKRSRSDDDYTNTALMGKKW